MELEKLKFICDVQVDELRRQIEPQQEELKEKRERVRQVCVGTKDLLTSIFPLVISYIDFFIFTDLQYPDIAPLIS